METVEYSSFLTNHGRAWLSKGLGCVKSSRMRDRNFRMPPGLGLHVQNSDGLAVSPFSSCLFLGQLRLIRWPVDEVGVEIGKDAELTRPRICSVEIGLPYS
jgi:hypothetical protein